MTCPRCAAPLPPNSLFCNRCGTKTTPSDAPPPANSGRWLVVVVGAVLATGVMGAVLASGALDSYISELDDKPTAPEKPTAPTSGAAPKPTSGAAAKPSSSPSPKPPPGSGPVARPTPPGSAFTVNLDSNPQGATITDPDGATIGQTPTSVVLPATTIVEFSLPSFDDTCRFELSSKLKDQTIKCTFRKPASGKNPDSIKPTTPPPTSAPVKKQPTDNTPKQPSSSPAKKKKPSSNPSH